MVPVLTASQIREADAYTIKNEPIASIDLMERASKAFVNTFLRLSEPGKTIYVFAGPGNNGGDALAIARILKKAGYRIEVWFCGKMESVSEDFKVNNDRLSKLLTIQTIQNDSDIPQIGEGIVIEGLFGSGLSRPVEGVFASVIQSINHSQSQVFSIDIPSGLFSDTHTPAGAIIKSNHTISFQAPKTVFFHPSAVEYVGTWHIADIGLNSEFIKSLDSETFFTEPGDLVFPSRSTFAHKGLAGKVLLISGSKGKVGASTLAARAAMRGGSGLLFIHAPGCARDILQINVPEAMVLEDEHIEIITKIDLQDQYDSIAIGPGIGTNELTAKAFHKFLEKLNQPIVVDADAINLLAQDQNLLGLLPHDSILTPHPGEFKRLVGEWKDDFQKLELLRSFCLENKVNTVLKGAYSSVCNTKGEIFFNPTGNPGMATGGSGDVLTGIIASFLGQGLNPFEALKASVYIHGLAGDLARDEVGMISLIASDIIENLSPALRIVENSS